MRKIDYAAFVRRQFETRIMVNIETKGEEYTEGRQDQFDNFKSGAKELHEGDKYTVHQIYTFKHLKSIRHWYKTRRTFSEHIEGRILDVITYLFLLLGMLFEDDAVDCPDCDVEDLLGEPGHEVINYCEVHAKQLDYSGAPIEKPDPSVLVSCAECGRLLITHTIKKNTNFNLPPHVCGVEPGRQLQPAHVLPHDASPEQIASAIDRVTFNDNRDADDGPAISKTPPFDPSKVNPNA